jgi:hypothetical protein
MGAPSGRPGPTANGRVMAVAGYILLPPHPTDRGYRFLEFEASLVCCYVFSSLFFFLPSASVWQTLGPREGKTIWYHGSCQIMPCQDGHDTPGCMYRTSKSLIDEPLLDSNGTTPTCDSTSLFLKPFC